MDLEDALTGRHPRARYPGRDGREPHVALTLLRAALARPWALLAACAVLLVVLVAGIWVSILLLGHVGEHGVKGLLEATLGLGTRLWEGR